MHKAIVALIIVLAVPAAAIDKTDILATVHQFADGLNKGDLKTGLAACADTSAIIDEFPPYSWYGATGCADWANDFGAFNAKNSITEAMVRLGKPRHLDISGDHAYVIIPSTYAYKQKGKAIKETGSLLTLALQRTTAGWKITAWAWSKH